MSIMALGLNFSTKNLAWGKRGEKFKWRPLLKEPPKGPVTKIQSPALAPSRVVRYFYSTKPSKATLITTFSVLMVSPPTMLILKFRAVRRRPL